jgi:hypothetical protein
VNLKLKLPLTFTGILASLIGAALIGIHSLNQSIDVYAVDVSAAHAHEIGIGKLLVASNGARQATCRLNHAAIG